MAGSIICLQEVPRWTSGRVIKSQKYGVHSSRCRTDEDERFGTITRMDPDGNNREIVAHGIRNTVGFTWHPDTNELWFTDNNRDMMGDDLPPGELNRITEVGQHFGYPFCHAGTIPDPELGVREGGDNGDNERNFTRYYR